ncbi:MAG: hypothetical protein H7329_11570 [Opitutaceae bacterium]|nr:hypothetical protein [Cytophagales bacterium]
MILTLKSRVGEVIGQYSSVNDLLEAEERFILESNEVKEFHKYNRVLETSIINYFSESPFIHDFVWYNQNDESKSYSFQIFETKV